MRLKNIRRLSQYKDLLTALETGLKKFDIDYYILGGIAKEIWMSDIHGIAPGRVTNDLDIAILMSSRHEYEELRNYLIGQCGFQEVKDIWHRLEYAGAVVDLLPFTKLSGAEQVVSDGTGYISTTFPGLDIVFENAVTPLRIEESGEYKVSTLPGIVVLKLLSWSDDKASRNKDIEDVIEIMVHFFDMWNEEIYVNHLDLFGKDDPNMNIVSAEVLGREIKKILPSDSNAYQKIHAILSENTRDVHTSEIGFKMEGHIGNTVEENLEILRHLLKGLNDTQIT
jgi:predicted nucleotidyltransferase